MTPILRIIACAIAGAFWLAAVVAKHFWADIDIQLFTATCAGVIGALGIHGMAAGGSKDNAPAGQAQAGFASLRLLIAIAALFVIACTTGCASISDAGHTAYDLKKSADGSSWEFSAGDGKEFQSRKITVDAKNGTMIVEEGASKAFKGQALAVKALTVLPVTGLVDLVAPSGADASSTMPSTAFPWSSTYTSPRAATVQVPSPVPAASTSK